MHYGKISFSTNGQPTIQALGNPDKQLGQRDGFSKTDIAQLNALYDCSGNIHWVSLQGKVFNLWAKS